MWTDACFIVGAVRDDIWTDLTNQLIQVGVYTALRERTLAGIVESVYSHQADLVFSELNLEDGNIFRLTQMISDHKPSLAVPLIMIGDDFHPSLVENASNAGVDFTLERPFQKDSLEETIRAALGEQ